jgi:hypothetical protein
MTKPWLENLFLLAALLIIVAFLPGCTGMLIGNALGQGQSLTPEQVAEYRKVNSKVYMCVQVAGPPPSGSTMWLVVPSESQFNPKFGDGCRLIP